MPLIPKYFKKLASETNPVKVMLDLYGAYQFSVFRHHFDLLIEMNKSVPFNSEIKSQKEAIRQWFRDGLSKKVLNEENFNDLNTILDIIENVATPEQIDNFYKKYHFDKNEGLYKSNDENFSDDEQRVKPRTLGEVCEVKVDFKDADFWLTRRSSLEKVGEPTKVFNLENIGIKVKTEFLNLIDPRYLYYWFMHLHGMGAFQEISTGSTKLVNISTDEIKNIRLQF